ncbi:PREDICTED: leucine-rich repeat receptor protein kinase EMS1 [Tarenaya hassleriana]|uniref:leucine-rich repeat receptor protein kinase EMS1 n=1 Tax=Tarenaya hassleriana TaxID=28532 RepID=UPI00053C4FB5|nr:PREDICTED: leucine-rich repeat receptor protein kinase EMS1 [Tarenaya hassleriana]
MDLKPNFIFFFPILLILILPINPNFVSASATPNPRCIATEREALLTFKNALTDSSGRLSSWTGPDCCSWTGVLCGDLTGHVIKIDLRNPNPITNSDEYRRGCLGGKLHPSLSRLRFLSYLDLSMNDFEGLEIPGFLGGIISLSYLNLSSSSFSGKIPEGLGNLSKLETLDLYAESFSDSGEFSLHASNLEWVSGLSSLSYLDMGYVNLSDVGEVWLEEFDRIPTLKELHLFKCELKSLPSSVSSVNLKQLEVLDLSENSLDSPVPEWLFGLTSLRKLFLRWDFLKGSIPSGFETLKLLEVLDLSNNLFLEGEIPQALGSLPLLKYLDLSANNLQGQIHGFLDASSRSKGGSSLVFLDLSSNNLAGTLPESLGALKNLQVLDLSSNSFTGSIPPSIGNMPFLKRLDLSFNSMDGTIPESLGKLKELVDLNLIQNSWEGILQSSHFVNLRNLKSISLTTEPNRSLVFNLPHGWIPPFRLSYIQIENCQIGPIFPMWLQIQTELTSVLLRNTGISGPIPDQWFSAIASEISYLNLADNRIKGRLPQKLEFPKLSTINLTSNSFEGSFPLWKTNATELLLYGNKLSGSLPRDIDVLMPRMQKIYLSHNNFDGEIPLSFCEISGLQIISLKNNHFSGEFPDCWHRSFMLWGIDVSKNNLSGGIPSSLGLLPSLSVLLLSGNVLEGRIPDSLQNCTGLTSIDLGGNKLTGTLPPWLEKMSSLFMLRLQANSFAGRFPDQLCSLPNLHILDLSGNKISGPIPKCIGNLPALAHGTSSEVFENLFYTVTRGRENGEIINIINLSGNSITGEIPGEILTLSYLRVLNLSRNSMDGSIPEKISELNRLETLDLSRNQFSGTIPRSLPAIASLQRLNLSFNHLEGRIPELLKFDDPSIYTGNKLLCGKPLPNKCPGDTHHNRLS